MAAPNYRLEENDSDSRNGVRAMAERMLAIAPSLPDKSDRDLIELLYGAAAPSVSKLASAAGVDPGKIRRRLQAIAKRMKDPVGLYIFESQKLFPPHLRQLLIQNVVYGKSIATICDDLQITDKQWAYAQVREQIEWAREQLRFRNGSNNSGKVA